MTAYLGGGSRDTDCVLCRIVMKLWQDLLLWLLLMFHVREWKEPWYILSRGYWIFVPILYMAGETMIPIVH